MSAVDSDKGEIIQMCEELEITEIVLLLELVQAIKARRVSGALSSQSEPITQPSQL